MERERILTDRQTDRQTDRIEYIDVAKGILIVLVVIGHLTNFGHILSYALKAIITTFHMPAFFIITGILTKPEHLQDISLKRHLSKKAFRLLIPYVFFELTGGLWQMLIMGSDNVNVKGIIHGILTVRCHVGADWFLPTLFFAELLLYFVVKSPRRWLYPVIGTVCAVTAFSLTDVSYFVACCRRVLIALTFILTGVFLRDLFIRKNIVAFIISVICVAIIAYFNRVVDLALRQFGNPLLYLLGGIIGAYSVLCFSQYVFGGLRSLLSQIGEASLIIMGTHQNIQVVFNQFFGSVYSFSVQVAAFTVTILYEVITIFLYKKYVPFLVGTQNHPKHKG